MKTVVIAEIGSNHGRTLANAKRAILGAKRAGAHAVKFQLFWAGGLYPETAGKARYLGSEEDIYTTIRRFELNPKWVPTIAAFANEQGLMFMASAFDRNSYALADRHVKIHKVASYEITNEPLLRQVGSFGKPVILSTGCSTDSEVSVAAGILMKAGAGRVIYAQCTGAYPAPDNSLNLRVISEWARRGRPVAFSDHSKGIHAAPLAVALGAIMVEKHFTMDRNADGPDHSFALEPNEFAKMVHLIGVAETMSGGPRKNVHPVEEELRGFCRRSLFLTADVEIGDHLSGHIAVLRNGNNKPGLPPRRAQEAESGVATRDLKAWTPIREGDFECA